MENESSEASKAVFQDRYNISNWYVSYTGPLSEYSMNAKHTPSHTQVTLRAVTIIDNLLLALPVNKSHDTCILEI